MHAITMPKLGQSEEEATILRWNKREGDRVAKGDVLFEIETDKAVLEVESFFEGTLLKILAPAGAAAAVQAVVAFVGNPGEALPEGNPQIPQISQTPAAQPAAVTPHSALRTPHSELRTPHSVSPRAARLAREHGIDTAQIAGSGPGGRIVEKDVEAAIGTRSQPSEKHSLEGYATLSRIRQAIAERTLESVRNAPHFFATVSADLTDLLARREQLKAEGHTYTLNDFILKAAAGALVEFPDFNSSTDGKSVWRHASVHLGMAVALDGGLVVPVIRDAQKLSLAELHDCAAALAEKARAGRLTPQEMSGSTFTVSNIGMLDVENFVAIINPPESAVLAVASVLKQPVVRNDQVVVRSMMKLTVSCDHRLIDGALAARFLNAVRRRLENPVMSDA